MISDVVLEVAGEGGSILLLRKSKDNVQHFWVETDETALYEMLSETDQEGIPSGFISHPVSSFESALRQLDSYPWSRLSPVSVHPEYREAVLVAVRTRLNLNEQGESAAIWERWTAVAGGLTSPSSGTPLVQANNGLMNRIIDRWEPGRIDRSGEYFELSALTGGQDNGDNESPIAAVGAPHEGVVRVEILVERSESNAALIAKVKREISFYLLELNESDPWAYAQYHCGTASNIYSDVHWSFFSGFQEPSETDKTVESFSPVHVEAQSGLKEGSIIVPRFYERDIDILLAEEFQVSPDFANWFLSATECAACQAGRVLEVAVSKSDNLGESDLIVLFESADSKSRFALYIEDKINAPLQHEQLARYRKRAEIGQQRGFYSHFHVVLCSPKAYRETHKDAEGFDAYLSFESIAGFLQENDPVSVRNLYRASIFANAATKLGHGGWKKETDPLTDSFWQGAYEIAIREFPDLEMRPPNFASGTTWISFRPHELPTQPRQVIADLKAANGFADLTFSGILCRLFAPLISSLPESDMTTHQAGRSTVIRLKISAFGISVFDSKAEEHVRAAFTACTRLIRFYREHRVALDAAASQSLPEPLGPVFIHPAEEGGAV
jgi:hypothetical protein